MTGQPAVLQVVILRDGLLVGTEVFVPGQYSIGSADSADLRLDDGTVKANHATLYFQNGRAAIQDAGSGAVFVNGHKVNACEVRPVDEINLGPFSLKVRVMSSKPKAQAPGPSAEVAALLSAPPSAPSLQPVTKGPPPSTVVSSRRQAEPPRPPAIAIEDAEESTQSVAAMTEEFASDPGMTAVMGDVPQPPPPPPQSLPPPPPPAAVAARPKPAPVQSRAQPAVAPAPPPPPAAAPPKPAPARVAQPVAAPARAAPARPAKARDRRTIPAANEGRGAPRLFIESYWGDLRKVARSYKSLPKKKQLIAAESDEAQYPLWGFKLKEPEFVLAEQGGRGVYRIYAPPGATVERRAQDGKFHAVAVETLDVGADQRRSITLGAGHAIRFNAENDVTLVAYVQAPIPKPFSNPFKGLPWLAMFMLAIFGSAFMSWVIFFTEARDDSDFQAKNVNPAAVRLIQPPKPEEKKKIEEKIKEIKKEEPKEPVKVAKKDPVPIPKAVPTETKKAIKEIEKIAAGPAMKDLLAAMDKLGAGPGKKDAKNDMKLSGLLGKAPIASAGLGSFGIGGGGAGGAGFKGAELLRGKGGGGIGALGAGNIGKGAVGGSVSHANARAVGAQGTIDKDAVAKVINSHLHEVSSCYERALLKESGLAGKIVLEWQITTSGTVGYAKTKSSTMKSAAVESCILASLKGWKFPAAKGTGVVITYPFMFNSVGY